MNKQKAIEWCKGLPAWPRSTNFLAPDGWKWVARNLPYQSTEYILQSTDITSTEYIEKSELK